MNLAIAELRRAKGRFVAITGSLSLIVFLVLVLGALGDGLFFGGTGAIRTSTATAYVFSSDATGSLVRSSVPLTDVPKIAATSGVDQATPIGALITSTPSVADGDIVVMGFGTSANPAGVPSQVTAGRLPTGSEAAAAIDEALADRGLRVGDSLIIGTQQVQVVGIVADASYQGLPTVWTPMEPYQQIRAEIRPETVGAPPAASVVGLILEPGVTPDELALPSGFTALDNESTYLSIPGIREQKTSLNAIVFASLAVGGLVVALFFALVVLEKRELFAALKALGASSTRLGGGVVFQAVGATVSAVIFGAFVARGLGYVLPQDIPFLFRPQTLMVSGTLTVLAGVIGALFSLRRISRIDPATALGGAL